MTLLWEWVYIFLLPILLLFFFLHHHQTQTYSLKASKLPTAISLQHRVLISLGQRLKSLANIDLLRSQNLSFCQLSPLLSNIHTTSPSVFETSLTMFLSTASTMFLSTAYLCLKGPSGLPSLLPTRECLDMAKQKNRRVRLLCKGLEQFREALYSEPTDATSKQDEIVPSAASPVAEATPDKESIVSAGTKTTRSSVKKPCTFYAADGEELFKTLFPKETPPTSPASVASSSTAVNPPSRKVSPSDIKDFAYPSDEHQVLDPTPIAESTRKQLLKQLTKKEAAEKKASRNLAKLAAKNEALNAKLTSANATVRNREAQSELAKTYANAMILSNTVLRQAIFDVGRSEHNDDSKGEALQEHLRIMDALNVGAHSGMTRLENHSAGQGRDSDKIQPKARVEESETSNALDIQGPDTVANLEDAKSANRTVLNEHKQRRIESENENRSAEEITEQGEANLEMIPADLHRNESVVRKGQEILHTIATTSEDSVPEDLEWSKSSGEDLVFEANRGSSSISEMEDLGPESDGDDAVTRKPIEDALTIHNDAQGTGSIDDCGINATYEFLEPAGPATMWGILQSNQVGRMGPEGDNDDKDVPDENSVGKGDINMIDKVPEPTGPATLWGILQSNQTIGEFETESNETTTTQEPISDVIYDQDTNGGRGEEVGATYEFLEPAGPATMSGVLQSNEAVGEMGPDGDHDDHKHVEEANGDTNTVYEFSEPAGPATLWEILQSHENVGDVVLEGDDDYNDVQGANGDPNTNYEFLEPAGPATMWGILQSNQTTEETNPEGDHTNDTASKDPIAHEHQLVDHVEAVDNGCEGARSQVHEFSEPSGAATLWGIVQSNQDDISEPNNSVTLCGTVQSSQDESAELTEPATLCRTLQSSPYEEVKENSALTVGEPDPGNDSNESHKDEPGAEKPGTQEPKVQELTTELDREEDYPQSKADAGEEAALEAAGPAPEAKDFPVDESEIAVSGVHGSLDEPQGDPEIETSTSHEVAFTLMRDSQDDIGNEGKFTEQGTANGDVLNIQPENKESTIVQGQADSGLVDLPLDEDSSVPLDKENGLSLTNLEEIPTPATSPYIAGNSNVQCCEEIGGKTLPSSDQSTSTQPAPHSLPEPEIFEFPCAIPKPRSEAEIKAEKKKAEHKRYKAKKKAEAAAKRRLKEKEEKEKEVAEEVEVPEPLKTLAQIQAEEDARLGDRRLKQQARRQEQQDRAASLRGVVRSSRAHLIY